MTATETGNPFTEAWRDHRPYLLNLAFRMLGDIGEAEDVVQEAFSRFLRAGIDEIQDERGWLIVVTSRLCLDQIRSARSRRERPTDLDAGESSLYGARLPGVDPADRITLDDSVRLALLVVLERLNPAERVVYVLHDVFQIPFPSIADTIGKSAATCRQLARRARQKIGDADGGKFYVGDSEHRLVTEKFVAACARGDMQGLLAVLAPDVSGHVDVGRRRDVVGADRVAQNIFRFWAGRATFVSLPVGEQPTLLAFVDRQLAAVMVLTVSGGLIKKINVIADPTRIGVLRSLLSARP